MLDAVFLERAAALHDPGMGTENAALLLYQLVCMLRPQRVLEVGAGYTTAWLARGLADARAAWVRDRACLQDPAAKPGRVGLLDPAALQATYRPRLHVIDNWSEQPARRAPLVSMLADGGLDNLVAFYDGDFRGQAAQLGAEAGTFELIWFDCGGPADYVAFLNEYWELLAPVHGLLALHYTYAEVAVRLGDRTFTRLLPTQPLNALKRRQQQAGTAAAFEVLSLVEPHKTAQGSITLLRRLPEFSRCRDDDPVEDSAAFYGTALPPLRLP
jgi:hypothetical protein